MLCMIGRNFICFTGALLIIQSRGMALTSFSEGSGILLKFFFSYEAPAHYSLCFSLALPERSRGMCGGGSSQTFRSLWHHHCDSAIERGSSTGGFFERESESGESWSWVWV